MLIVKKVELINKYKFLKAVLNKNSETFVVHIALLKNNEIHSFKAPLIAALQ